MKIKSFGCVKRSPNTMIVGLLLAGSLSSCKKDTKMLSSSNNNETKKISAFFNYNVDLRPLNMTEPELYLYPQDKAMERIDMARYALGKAFKDLVTPEMLQKIKSEAGQRLNSSILYSKLFEIFPDLERSLNENLSGQSLPECPYDFSSYDKIKEALYNDYDSYEPELYLFNLASDPNTSSFILSPSLEIEDEKGFDDQIMAWYKSGTSEATAIKINEIEARLTNVLLATIGLQGHIVWPGNNNGGTTPNPPTPTLYKTISMQRVNIHYRYEKKGKSEVYAYGIQSSGSTGFEKCFSTFPGDFSRHLTSTKKTWQWVDCDQNTLLFDAGKNVIWNTFERDWYQPWQPIASFSGANDNNAWVPMTFGDEWYALIPSTNGLSNGKSLRNGSALKNTIFTNGSNWTYFQGENNKFECYFNAQQ